MKSCSYFCGLLLALSCFVSACSSGSSSTTPPKRDCSKLVVAEASKPGASMGIKGSWDGWNGVSVEMKPRSDGKYEARFALPPGEYGYVIVEDGTERYDRTNPLTAFHGGQEVSWFQSEDCSVPSIEVESVMELEDGLRVEARFYTAEGGEALAGETVRAVTTSGRELTRLRADASTGMIVLEVRGLERGKYTVQLEASDEAGKRAEPKLAVGWVRPDARGWGDGILYQVMIDRYLGSDGGHLDAPKTPGSRAGGTLDGVRSAIESGQLSYLGVSGVWLSPVYRNPIEAREGQWDGRMYEGYHGYWPVHSQQVEDRIGGAKAMHALVRAAHERGIRVLLDIVPNHVYETNPIFQQHQGDLWFYDGVDKCVCGEPQCPWSTHIQTCWFTSYLPDYRWTNIDVMRHGEQESVWWLKTFDLDGVRVDAVPMMPRAALRRIAHGLRSYAAPRSEVFILGEVYTGGGQGGVDQIRYFLGPDGLDSAFDFPLMWDMRETIAHGTGGFQHIAQITEATQESYAGSGVVLGRIVGNHDTTRFLSEANGDAGGDAWDNPPEQPNRLEPYQRHKMAMALVLTLPGLPVIYYGDELGLAGGGDPDCRRVMPRIEELNSYQYQLLVDTGKFGRLRRCSAALRLGKTITLQADQDTFAYVRDAGDGFSVVVLMSKAKQQREVMISGQAAGVFVDVLTGERFSVAEAGTNVPVDSLQVRVLVRETDECRGVL